MSTSQLSTAQQTQMDNRDETGKWKSKTHTDVEDSAAVLGVSDEDSTMLSYVEGVAYYPGEDVKTGWAKDPSGEDWTTVIEAADGQFDVYAVRDFGGKTGDVQRAESYSEAEETLEQLETDIVSGAHYRKSFGANELNFNSEVSSEVASFFRGGGVGNFTKEAGDFMGDIGSRVLEAPANSEVSSAGIAAAMSEEFDADISASDVQPVLTSLRNEGQLLATPRTVEDGEYLKARHRRPSPVGETITVSQLRGRFSTGHKVDIDVWQTSVGYDTEIALEDTADLDGYSETGSLHLVNGENDLEDNYGDYLVPAGAEGAHITESKDGRITIDVPETATDTGDVVPGSRHVIRLSEVEDSWTGTRPIVDDQGRESPFDVGPRQYAPHPDFVADSEHVALTQDVYDPSAGKLGTIYQDDDEWAIDRGPDDDLDAPRFDDPQHAAEWLHRASGGRGTWAKPTAENIALPGI